MRILLNKIFSFSAIYLLAISLAFQPILDAAVLDLTDCETTSEQHLDTCHTDNYRLSHDHNVDSEEINASEHNAEHEHHIHFSHACSNVYFIDAYSIFNHVNSVHFKPLIFESLLHPVLNPNTLYRPPRTFS